MPGSSLLDTNIAVALLAGEDAVHAVLNQSGLIFLSSVVLGELFYGARKSVRREANLARVEAPTSASVTDHEPTGPSPFSFHSLYKPQAAMLQQSRILPSSSIASNSAIEVLRRMRSCSSGSGSEAASVNPRAR